MGIKASIIIRAYNAQNYIKRAVGSALNQDFPKDQYEVVVVNDGSHDKTREILSEYETFPNINIVIFDQENHGGIQAGNKGAEISRGEYIVLLDADDEFEANLLSELCQILDNDSALDFVYSDYYEEFRGDKILVTPDSFFQSVAGGILFRKSSLMKEGFLREGVFFCEYDLFLRTIDKWTGFYCQKPLFTYHRRAVSMTGDSSRVRKAIAQLKELHPDKLDYISKIRSYKL